MVKILKAKIRRYLFPVFKSLGIPGH